MDMKIITPVHIFINGKFFCVADGIEVVRDDPRFKKELSNGVSGAVLNISRKPRTKEEIEEVESEKKKGTYDEFFNRMVSAVDDPNSRIPVDTSDI